MNTIFTFFKRKLFPNMVLIFFFSFSLINNILGQITGTEDFENETVGATSFITDSAPTISFNTTFPIVTYPGGFGYNNSLKFLEIFRVAPSASATATISLNTGAHPGVGYKINSFAAYTSNSNGGATPYNGILTISGTPVGGGPVLSANINVGSASGALPAGQTREANGMVNGINLTGTPLAGLYFTTLTFTIVDTDLSNGNIGTGYLGLDHISFTTEPAINNNYAIGNINYIEGNAGTTVQSFNVTRSVNTLAGSVQIQSSNITATAGSDYVAVPLTTVNFTAGGPLTQTVNITINGDVTIEPNETFNMTLSNPVGGTITSGTGVVTILDDDQNAEIFDDEVNNALTFSQNGNNFTTTGKLKVHVGGNFGAGGSTGYAMPNEPYATGNQGSFQLTSPGKSFYVTSVDLWSAVVSGTGPNWVYTPTNCTVTFTGTKFDGSGTVTHSAAITPTGTNGHFTVNFAGSPLANVNLLALSFSVPSPITYLQIDNFKYGITSSNAVQVSINDVSVLEGTGGGPNSATFTVSRTNNTTSFTVDAYSSAGTATEGVDYTAFPTTILTFTSGGALSQTVSVPILKDAAIEGNETFNMNLMNLTNGTLYLKQVGVGTILDDDKICETFDTDVNNATTFTENGINFSASNRFKVVNSGNTNGQGSNTSPGFLIGTNGAIGSMGKMTITSPNKAFKLFSLDVWASSNGSSATPGNVTFTATLFGSATTVTTTKAIASNTSNGWHQNVLFTGTPLDNVLLTDLEVISTSPLTEVDIDNFCYAVFNPVPIIELADLNNVAITNGGAASLGNNTDFGAVCITGGTVSKTFTIKNTGAVNLTLTGLPLVISGGDASHFSISSQPTTPIIPGGSTTFTVVFDPNSAGLKNANISFINNDATNSSFVVNLKGTGNALLLAATAGTYSQDVANNTFVDANCTYFGKIEPIAPAPVSGNITIKSWLEANASFGYVPRHYEINPATNATTATANITLYFSQADFDAYNALNSTKLPQNPTDTPNLANIQLVKFAGVSSPSNGLPGSYTGGGVDKTADIISKTWNGQFWEIKFATTGFSGFFIKTASAPLPINLISFTGKNTEKGNLLNWKTANERNFSHFEIERSPLNSPLTPGGGIFAKIGQVTLNETRNYEFMDAYATSRGWGGFYRLKMVDLDGKFAYSKIIAIENNFDKNIIGQFYPNPSSGKSFIYITAHESGNWNISNFDLTGKILNSESKFLQKGLNKISVEKLNQGVNFIRFENGLISEIRKVIVE